MPSTVKIMIVKSVGVWILFVILAILNGGLRERILVPYLGQLLALPLSGLLLSVLIFLVSLAVFPFLSIARSSQAWLVGVLWVVLTIAFEFLFGHFVMGDSWRKLLEAYEVWEGNLWIVVLAAILSSPYLAGKLRGAI
jgi:hypothetical protein